MCTKVRIKYIFALRMKELFEEKNLFLQKVELSGFKSIKSASINLKKGLNIIIGKNAVGKTNFLTFLEGLLQFSYEDFSSFESQIHFVSGKEKVIIKYQRTDPITDNSLKEYLVSANEVKTDILVNGQILGKTSDDNRTAFHRLSKYGIKYNCSFIRHGIPQQFALINDPLTIKIPNKLLPFDLLNMATDPDVPFFIKNIYARTFLHFDQNQNSENANYSIEKLFNTDRIKEYVKKFSPIENFRLSQNYNIFVDKKTNETTINNLFFEFKINGSWLPFSSLSDGTKRLFYIIAEVASEDIFHFGQKSIGIGDSIKRIILIEEPELGIHPHQLNQLMVFLREQSEQNQIIITTHSPEILNILDHNELDRINIAFKDKRSNSTKFRGLNETENQKAIEFLKHDYLSDYWVYSDLEKY